MKFAHGSLILILSSLICPPVHADGLIRNGHIVSPYTVLTLSKEQVKALDKGALTIEMTPAQRQIMSSLPHANLVSKLYVYPKNVHTCTCEKVDAAVRADKTHVEVSHWLFAREYSEGALMDYWRQDYYEIEKDKTLTEAVSLREKNLPKAIEIFENKLSAEKDNKLLRHYLSQLYFERGKALLAKGDKAGAIKAFETSILDVKGSWYEKAHKRLANENLALARAK